MKFIPLEEVTKFLEDRIEEGFHGEIAIKMQNGIIGAVRPTEHIDEIKNGKPIRKK